LAILLIAFWISLAAASASSANPAISLSGSNWRRLGLLTWTAILILAGLYSWFAAGQSARIRQCLRSVAAAGLVASIYGISQYFGFDPLLPKPDYHVGTGEWTIVRTPGTLGHAAYFSVFLLLSLFSSIGLALTETSRAWGIAGRLVAGLSMVAIAFSGTRAAMLGGVIGGLYLLSMLRLRIVPRAVAASVAVVVLAGGFYFSPLGQQLRSRSRWFLEDPFGGARLLMWRDSLRMAAANPISGSGLETYSAEFPKHQSLELSRRFPDFHHESPHNILFDALTAQGLPGALILGGIAVFGLVTAAAASRKDLPLSAALGASWVALLVTHQFTCFTAPTAFFFFLVLALLAATGTPPNGYKVATRTSVLPLQIASAGVVTILLIFSTQLVTADLTLARVRDALNQGHLTAAMRLYEQVLDRQPLGMSADLWYSRALAAAAERTSTLLVRIEAWQDANRAAVRATEASEEPHNAWYSLATVAAARNDAALTESALRAAIAASPNWYKPRWVLARLLHLTSRQREAEAQIASAVDRGGGRHAEVAETEQLITASRSK
jgi:O-antigen ligase